ncbi:hypothetical protein AYI68_g1933 [Smittium mucronatum]|uniref:Uncharacterized protein n=1 Tax=Smittium mucronatum TaxID=133383 RepID=A0A1R0H455_9FUNG|nr:hypothetical protein AYI68_g1933 [Smittium mucronatum]
MSSDKLALSKPSDKETNETAVDFSGFPERFSGKTDSISVDVWTFTLKNVCKIKKWNEKTILKEREKKETAVLRCSTCNAYGHTFTNCTNRNNSYKDKNYSRNNYPQKEYNSQNMQGGTKNEKDNKDIMLFEKIVDENLLVANKQIRIDTILDNSESDREFSPKAKHKAVKKTKKSTKKQKKINEKDQKQDF